MICNLYLKKRRPAQDWNYNLMATVMKVYTYQVLVDLYDQVPYTDALQGELIFSRNLIMATVFMNHC